MKIKTITTWADYNYGASLQAYALLNFLKERGHDVELIKYLPSYQTRMIIYGLIPNQKLLDMFLLDGCIVLQNFAKE